MPGLDQPGRCEFGAGLPPTLGDGTSRLLLVEGNSISYGTANRAAINPTGDSIDARLSPAWPQKMADRIAGLWGGTRHGLGFLPCDLGTSDDRWTLTNTSGSSAAQENVGVGYDTVLLAAADYVNLNKPFTGATHLRVHYAASNSAFSGVVVADKIDVIVDGSTVAEVQTRDTSLGTNGETDSGRRSALIGPFDPDTAHTLRLACANDNGATLPAAYVSGVEFIADGSELDDPGLTVINAARPSYALSSICTTGALGATTRRTTRRQYLTNLAPDLLLAQWAYNSRATSVADWMVVWGRYRDDIVAYAPDGMPVAAGIDPYLTSDWDGADGLCGTSAAAGTPSLAEVADALAGFCQDNGWTYVPVPERTRTTPTGLLGFAGRNYGPDGDGWGALADGTHPTDAFQTHLADVWESAVVGGDEPTTWLAKQDADPAAEFDPTGWNTDNQLAGLWASDPRLDDAPGSNVVGWPDLTADTEWVAPTPLARPQNLTSPGFTTTDGRPRRAVQFTGNPEHLIGPTLNGAAEPFTVVAVVRSSTLAGKLLGNGTATDGLGWNNGRLLDFTAAQLAGTPTADLWEQWTVLVDGEDSKWWVNGELQAWAGSLFGVAGVLNRLSLGVDNNAGASGNDWASTSVALLRIFDGDITGTAGYATYIGRLLGYYGLPWGATAGFSPWSADYPTPLHAVWAGDPDWSNPGDGNAVSSWRNESGGGDPAQGTGTAQPTYHTSGFGPNSVSRVSFDGGDYLALDVVDVSQPLRLLVIAKLDSTAAQSRITQFPFIGVATGGNWRWDAGTTTDTGVAADTDPHIHEVVFDGASSTWGIDGTEIDAANVGVGDLTRLDIGGTGGGAQLITGDIHYIGWYAGAADLSGLVAAFATHTGITVA